MPAAAVLLALATILLWSFLAFLGSSLAHLPPLLVVGIALLVGSLFGLPRWRQWKVPLRTLAVGIGGLFGYHFLLFTAFQHAPTVEANLINYLWPLSIVILSPVILPGFNLRPHHVLGALLGMAGAALIATGGLFRLDLANLQGYLYALAAAVTWALYSLLTRRLPPFPTGAVGGFCFASGLLAVGIQLLQNPDPGLLRSITPLNAVFLALAGAGPLGAAFYTWDAALKRGDPRVIGALSYLTPLLSTLWLVLLGGKPFSWVSAAAMLLIIAGALVGSLDLLKKSRA